MEPDPQKPEKHKLFSISDTVGIGYLHGVRMTVVLDRGNLLMVNRLALT